LEVCIQSMFSPILGNCSTNILVRPDSQVWEVGQLGFLRPLIIYSPFFFVEKYVAVLVNVI
jgi:hypothetical protein